MIRIPDRAQCKERAVLRVGTAFRNKTPERWVSTRVNYALFLGATVEELAVESWVPAEVIQGMVRVGPRQSAPPASGLGEASS